MQLFALFKRSIGNPFQWGINLWELSILFPKKTLTYLGRIHIWISQAQIFLNNRQDAGRFSMFLKYWPRFFQLKVCWWDQPNQSLWHCRVSRPLSNHSWNRHLSQGTSALLHLLATFSRRWKTWIKLRSYNCSVNQNQQFWNLSKHILWYW